MVIGNIPKARIIFNDSRQEEAIGVVLLGAAAYVFSESGIYSYIYDVNNPNQIIYRYHPEHIEVEMHSMGSNPPLYYLIAEIEEKEERRNFEALKFEDSGNCWLPDADVKDIMVCFELINR